MHIRTIATMKLQNADGLATIEIALVLKDIPLTKLPTLV